MERYILMSCLECQHTFKSNFKTKHPRCSQCKSQNVIEAKQIKNSELKNEIGTLKKYVIQKAKKQDELIQQFNLLVDSFMELKNTHPQPHTNKSTCDNPKEGKPLSISQRLDAIR